MTPQQVAKRALKALSEPKPFDLAGIIPPEHHGKVCGYVADYLREIGHGSRLQPTPQGIYTRKIKGLGTVRWTIGRDENGPYLRVKLGQRWRIWSRCSAQPELIITKGKQEEPDHAKWTEVAEVFGVLTELAETAPAVSNL